MFICVFCVDLCFTFMRVARILFIIKIYFGGQFGKALSNKRAFSLVVLYYAQISVLSVLFVQCKIEYKIFGNIVPP